MADSGIVDEQTGLFHILKAEPIYDENSSGPFSTRAYNTNSKCFGHLSEPKSTNCFLKHLKKAQITQITTTEFGLGFLGCEFSEYRILNQNNHFCSWNEMFSWLSPFDIFNWTNSGKELA